MLYAVTDQAWTSQNTLAEQVEQAILGGATFIQLREKNLCDDELLAKAKQLKAVTDQYKVPFVINDHIDIAIQMNADGVHIGQDDTPVSVAREKIGMEKILGVSARNVQEAVQAERDGADYLGVGAVFSTSTKEDAKSVSLETLKEICETVSIPVIAIGGINETNISTLAGSGIVGVAVVSAIFSKANIKEATRELLTLTNEMVKQVNI